MSFLIETITSRLMAARHESSLRDDMERKPDDYEVEVEKWAMQNSEIIVAALEKEHQRKRKKKQKEEFDLSRRMLSEMPLCASLEHIYKKTGVFRMTTPSPGQLLLTKNHNPLGLKQVQFYHKFAYNSKNGYILDFTFWQAVKSDCELFRRGQRIEKTRTAIPEMITILNAQKGVAMLCGNRDEIYMKTGLYYLL